jgi:uncharacterized membrane protein
MKSASVAGLVLIVLGVLALAYQGFTYTTHKKVLDIGPIQATKEEHNTIPLPPIVGGLALIGGIVLMVAGNKS